jgi:CHAD domain-containing protein
MDYSIDLRNDTTEEIKGSLLKLVSFIEQESDFENPHLEESVHTIRKTLKKIRAILVLIRDEIGYSSYLREKSIYQNIAKQLAEYRNLDVFYDLARDLDQKFRQELCYSCLTQLIRQIRARKEEDLNKLKTNEAYITSLKRQLTIAKLNIEKISLEDNSFSALLNGLKNSYKKSRNLLKRVSNTLSEDHVHPLRKALKNLDYQIRCIINVNPLICKAYSKSVDSVCTLLGEFHDYAEFKTFYTQAKARGLSRSNRNILNKLIDDLAGEKLTAALPQAKLALIEKPTDFINRISRYWEVRVNTVENSALNQAY